MDGSTLHFIDSYHLLSYGSIDSTNEEAKRLADAGGQHGAVIWAEAQTHGKGRQGREWVSERGNLFCSLLLQPCAPSDALPQLSFVTSLAVYKALASVVEAPHQLSLKWPNDILLDDRKLGGILLETMPVQGNDARWVIIGVGVNVEQAPSDVRYPATSLKAVGLEIISPKIVLSRFLNCFQPLYDQWLEQGFEHIRQQWLDACTWLHQPVILELQDGAIVQETFCDVNEEGHIVLLDQNNRRQTYAAGDVMRTGVDAAGN